MSGVDHCNDGVSFLGNYSDYECIRCKLNAFHLLNSGESVVDSTECQDTELVGYRLH